MALTPQPLPNGRFPAAGGPIGATTQLFSNAGGYRGQPQAQAPEPEDVTIQIQPQSNTLGLAGGLQVTEDPNGDVSIGPIAEPTKEPVKNDRFDENLAETIGATALGMLASDLLEGIEADITSRQDWVSTYIKGMDLLGLKIEQPSNVRNRKKNSTVVHPLMTEAIVTFQSMARAELLPASGPAKVRNDGAETSQANDLAEKFEKDFNHYLTTVATEYYPDTDRALFYLGYGGTIFKKVYNCPVRKRPVSEAVYLPDLIVFNDATDLENAPRITHKIEMTRAQIRRLQLNGFYRDVSLPLPSPVTGQDQIRQKEQSLAGRTPSTITRPKDAPNTVFECYCEIVPADYGFDEPGAPEGLPLPYRVSIERSSRVVLEVRRNWKAGDVGSNGYRRKKMFVKFGMVPSFGFLDLGFLHLHGNQTRALTAIWRILIDAGLYANFPGGMKIKGTRQSTNEMTPGPGEWVEVDTGPATDIRAAFMPFPYKQPDATFMQFADNIAEQSRRIGGAVELQVGEGRTNAPVGTVMAMIEQQTQVMAAVHKRLHTAQTEELQLLRDLFMEDPGALSRFARNPQRAWETAEEFADLDLVPATDPNTPSQVHRLLQANGLAMYSETPNGKANLDGREVCKIVLQAMQIPPMGVMTQQQPQGDGGQQAALVGLANKQLDNERLATQVKAESERGKLDVQRQKLVADVQGGAADRAKDERIAGLKAGVELVKHAHEVDKTRGTLHLGQQAQGLANAQHVHTVNKDFATLLQQQAAQAASGARLEKEQDASVKAQQPQVSKP